MHSGGGGGCGGGGNRYDIALNRHGGGGGGGERGRRLCCVVEQSKGWYVVVKDFTWSPLKKKVGFDPDDRDVAVQFGRKTYFRISIRHLCRFVVAVLGRASLNQMSRFRFLQVAPAQRLQPLPSDPDGDFPAQRTDAGDGRLGPWGMMSRDSRSPPLGGYSPTLELALEFLPHVPDWACRAFMVTPSSTNPS